eukprot:30926-Pelagococcus_subviridis.AAC.4
MEGGRTIYFFRARERTTPFQKKISTHARRSLPRYSSSLSPLLRLLPRTHAQVDRHARLLLLLPPAAARVDPEVVGVLPQLREEFVRRARLSSDERHLRSILAPDLADVEMLQLEVPRGLGVERLRGDDAVAAGMLGEPTLHV